MPGFNATLGSGGLVVSRKRGYPTMYIENLRTIYTTGTTVTIDSGSCRDDSDVKDIILVNPTVCNIAVVGANGLDVGVAANNTWYYLFVIADIQDGVPVATLLSLSATAPNLPVGYNVQRRVGVVRRDNVGVFHLFAQSWTSRERLYIWDETASLAAIDDFHVLRNGNAVVFTNVSCATAIPPVSTLAVLCLNLIAPNFDSMWVRPNGSTVVLPVCNITDNGYDGAVILIWIPTDNNGIVEYMVSNAVDAAHIMVCGFIDQLD